ncbi:hypothetical protein WK25_16755 [Burkholderia latens]|nr:hypothetical protein WK25_16755 [Burkholderia latens]
MSAGVPAAMREHARGIGASIRLTADDAGGGTRRLKRGCRRAVRTGCSHAIAFTSPSSAGSAC